MSTLKDSPMIKHIIFFFIISTLAFSNSLTVADRATVTHIADGDTIDIEFEGGVSERIRIIGIQAMEVGTPDECYANEATDKLTEILGGIGATVILKAIDVNSENDGRLFRHVFLLDGNQEIDVSERLLEEGVVMPFPIEEENTYDEEYGIAAQKAKDQELGLWSSVNHCASPSDSEGTSFELFINYDAPGDDRYNLAGEWVTVKNTSGKTVDISGWVLNEKGHEYFYFPAGTVLDNNEKVTIIGGQGTDSGNTFYWGNTNTIFANYADGIYLFEYLNNSTSPGDAYYPRGNLKASLQYPCFGNCTDSLQGKISLKVNYDADGDDSINPNGEWIAITNISSTDINLKNYYVYSLPEGSNSYLFKDDTIVHSNEILYLYIGEGTDSSLKKYWGNSTSILTNSEDKVWISTYDRIMIIDYAWPASAASAEPMPRIMADVNGDDMEDIIGFGTKGVNVALSTGTGFSSTSLWLTNFGYDQGWRSDTMLRKMADVNGDGMADVVGFGNSGVYVSLSDGSGFEDASLWVNDFGYDQGWRLDKGIRVLADVDGDGMADVVGFGNKGVNVALSTGTGFEPARLWVSNFGYDQGWINTKGLRFMSDVDGDGKADIVGFGNNGVYIGISTGTSFGDAPLWVNNFGYNQGWRNDKSLRYMSDVNNDGKADIVGFGNNGVYVGLSTGSSFGNAPLWVNNFGYNQGWRNDKGLRTMSDVNGDGYADIVGFGNGGVYVGLSTGTSFGNAPLWVTNFGYDQGWRNDTHLRLMADVDGDGATDVVGFGNGGASVSTSTGANLTNTSLWLNDFGYDQGWKVDFSIYQEQQ